MTNFHTLKLGVSAIGAGAPRIPRDDAPAATETIELPAVEAEEAPAAAETRKARERFSSSRLLGLGVISAATVLGAVAATGSIHSTIFRIAASAAALTVAAGVLAALAINFKRSPVASAPAGTATTRARSLSKTKIALLCVMALGFASYFGGGGSFANFSAETTNPGDQVAGGTLTMSNQVNSNTACMSFNGASHNNVNSLCDAAFTLTSSSTNNVAPGVFGGTAQITIQNTGSLAASKLSVYAPFVNGNTNASIGTGAVSSISVLNLEGTITGSDSLTVAYGSQSITLSVTGGPYTPPANPATTAVTVNVTGTNGTGSSIPSGATVVDTSSDTTAANTDCYDQKTTAAPTQVPGATFGTNLNFNSTTNNPLCSNLMMFVQEIGAGKNYCWFGTIAGGTGGGLANSVANNATASGMCAAPISTTLGSGGVLSGGAISASGTLNFGAAIRGNVKSGDALLITENDNQVTCTATANAFITATSVTVNSCSLTSGAGTANSFDTSAIVTDSTTLANLNPGAPTWTASTISNFDTAHNAGNSKIYMGPVTSNGVADANNPVQLAATGTRTFYVGVFLPAGTGSNQNSFQGLMSTFGLTWHLDQ